MPQLHCAAVGRSSGTPLSESGWTAFETGRLYAQLGYTMAIEPAVLPHHALHAHLELADIPIIDKGFLTVLRNDNFLLQALRDRESDTAIADYVGANLSATRAIGIKCANPGGVCGCKQNMRGFSLDDTVPEYGVSARDIVTRPQRAVKATGIAHPLHLHMNNLGQTSTPRLPRSPPRKGRSCISGCREPCSASPVRRSRMRNCPSCRCLDTETSGWSGRPPCGAPPVVRRGSEKA